MIRAAHSGTTTFTTTRCCRKSCAPPSASTNRSSRLAMPPHQTGILLAWQTSCTFLASVKPPTRPTLMLNDPAGSGFDGAGGNREPARIDSSRQMAGRNSFFCSPARGSKCRRSRVAARHQEVELVELTQVLEFIERVGGVGVYAQRDVRPARAGLFRECSHPSRVSP